MSQSYAATAVMARKNTLVAIRPACIRQLGGDFGLAVVDGDGDALLDVHDLLVGDKFAHRSRIDVVSVHALRAINLPPACSAPCRPRVRSAILSIGRPRTESTFWRKLELTPGHRRLLLR